MDDLLDNRLVNRSRLRACDVEKIGCDKIDEVLRDRTINREAIKTCRAKNRRVEFKILEVGGRPIEADTSVIIEKEKVIEMPPGQKAPEAAGEETPPKRPAPEADAPVEGPRGEGARPEGEPSSGDQDDTGAPTTSAPEGSQ